MLGVVAVVLQLRVLGRRQAIPRPAKLAEILLAHHNGEIPHDLALLGYLYLLDVLIHPRELALRLYGDGRS